MNWTTRKVLILSVLAALLLGAAAVTSFRPRDVQASGLAAFGPQMKITVLNIPTAAKDLKGVYVKIADVGVFQSENGSSLLEISHQGRLYVQAVQGNDVVYFQLRVDDQPGMEETGQYHLTKRESNQEIPASFAGYWQGLAAGKHTVSIWAKAGTSQGSATGATMDYLSHPDNLVIVKEYLPSGTTYLPSVQR
jgi:hypothetical protein